MAGSDAMLYRNFKLHYLFQVSTYNNIFDCIINYHQVKIIIVEMSCVYTLKVVYKRMTSQSIKYFLQAYKCMYVVLIMATYWVLELLPLPVTSMLPIVLFPTLGILDSDRTCAAYMKETNMMFMGGLMIAAGVQHSKLPKRVALWTVQVVGCSHRR